MKAEDGPAPLLPHPSSFPGDGLLIGLEVHVQLNRLRTKLFCGCPCDYQEAEPNTRVCEVCLGLPGALPNINRRAVEAGLSVARALRCEVADRTLFYRKNYFYPDLPRGFQISQYDFPLATGGRVLLDGDGAGPPTQPRSNPEHEGRGPRRREIRIRRVHMEEDPGRLLYPGGSIETAPYSLIDYNRSGVGLLEVVTEPDLRSPREARRFLQALRTVLEYLEVCDPEREGALRADANISLAGGNRVEVKNIGSAKGVERALTFEIARQKGLLRRGQRIAQETRHYDEARGITTPLRGKETEEDYRYFPEPDLVPFRVKEWGERVSLPELPDAKAERFVGEFSISEQHARVLAGEYRLARLFEAVAKEVEPKLAATWIADIYQGEVNFRDGRYRRLRSPEMAEAARRMGLRNFRAYPDTDVGLPFRPDFLAETPEGAWAMGVVREHLYDVEPGEIEGQRAEVARKSGRPVKAVIWAPGLLDPGPSEEARRVRASLEAAGAVLVDADRNPLPAPAPLREVAPGAMVELLRLLQSGEVSDPAAVAVLRSLLDDGGSPRDLVSRLGLAKAEASEIGEAVEAVLGENPRAAGDYKGGKPEALNFLVGQVLKRLKGRADAAEVRKALQKRL
ncbi:MAG: Asp-tRNA(Asn)/Glu-tRNA(Gln) amidotransferase subunit GatB [Halobacteria archaeon]